jgi:hypothetical protein
VNDTNNSTPLKQEDRALLDALLDTIIPPKDPLKGAGALGVADFLALRTEDVPGLGERIQQVIARANELLQDTGCENFPALSIDDREAIVRKIQDDQPAAFKAFQKYTYMGYYIHPAIQPHYGLADHPPQPLGNDLPAESPEELEQLLEPVKSRGQVYRDC